MSQNKQAKNSKYDPKNNSKKKNNKALRDKDGNRVYRNPVNNHVGRIIIAILAILMALSPVITLIAMAIAGKL